MWKAGAYNGMYIYVCGHETWGGEVLSPDKHEVNLRIDDGVAKNEVSRLKPGIRYGLKFTFALFDSECISSNLGYHRCLPLYSLPCRLLGSPYLVHCMLRSVFALLPARFRLPHSYLLVSSQIRLGITLRLRLQLLQLLSYPLLLVLGDAGRREQAAGY